MNIYVGNLDFKLTEEELRLVFEKYGEVESARIIFDRATNRSRGFGFVEMPDNDKAQTAIDELHKSDFNGRPLTVNEAKPRRTGGGGGGRSFDGGGRRNYGYNRD